MVPGPSRGGRARVVMGDFRPLAVSGDLGIVAWLVEEEAREEGPPAALVCNGAGATVPKAPSLARA